MNNAKGSALTRERSVDVHSSDGLIQKKGFQSTSEKRLRRATLGITRKGDCQYSCDPLAEQGLGRHNRSTQFGRRRWNERLGSGSTRDRLRQERAQGLETRLPALLRFRFLSSSDRALMRPVLPAACWNVALHATDRQRRKERSSAKEQHEQRCDNAAQSVLNAQQWSNSGRDGRHLHPPLARLHELLGSGVKFFLVSGHAEIVRLSLVDRAERRCTINIHVAYGADWVFVG
jgi:hypothetical protein